MASLFCLLRLPLALVLGTPRPISDFTLFVSDRFYQLAVGSGLTPLCSLLTQVSTPLTEAPRFFMLRLALEMVYGTPIPISDFTRFVSDRFYQLAVGSGLTPLC